MDDRYTKAFEEVNSKNAAMKYQEEVGSGASIMPGVSNREVCENHTPSQIEIQRIETIRAAARNFMDAIDANCPSCADKTAAKRKVREAMMTANAAIALRGAV